MGQKLSSPESGTLQIVITCDGDHGLFLGGGTIIKGTDYIDMRKIVANSGFRRIAGGKWLGPCCAKVKASAETE